MASGSLHYCWENVIDGGPTLHQHMVNVSSEVCVTNVRVDLV